MNPQAAIITSVVQQRRNQLLYDWLKAWSTGPGPLMPDAVNMAEDPHGELIGPKGELSPIILLKDIASNCPLDLYLYTHRLVLLSHCIREVSLGSGRRLT